MEMIKEKLRTVPNFPKEGILYYDITPVLQDPVIFGSVLEIMADPYRRKKIEVVCSMESRGFIFGSALANEIGAGFVPIRKPGKLPWKTVRAEYELEYGTDALEMHKDAITKGQRVLIADDLLATGGTAAATLELLKGLEAEIVGATFVIELLELGGRKKLDGIEIRSIVTF